MGERFLKGSVVALFGDLGAGKTHLVKGLAWGFAGIDPGAVQSPTFIHLNIYQGKGVVYHFDLYRMSNAEDFLSMGFDDYLFRNGLCCIEWAERIQPILPRDTITICLSHLGCDRRLIEIPLPQAAKLWGDNPTEHEGA